MSRWPSLDQPAVLALNAASEVETSPLDAADLQQLCDQAFHVGLADRGRAAFLIALDQDAAYDSANFLWFKARYPRFVYVDRIVVAAAARGRSLAKRLYGELYALAADTGHVRVTCEVNIEPPNPASWAFHAAQGFAEVGRGSSVAPPKVVSYLVRPVVALAPPRPVESR
jgi:predicted GNAT superfamily acetyltransferase